jgi:hypothetical protein
MNVPFKLKDESLDEAFLKGAQQRGMLQLKGHRSVGGMRASIYNAMPVEGVKALVAYMKEFEGPVPPTGERAMRRPALQRAGAEPDLARGLERLPAERYTVGKDVPHPDAVLVRSATCSRCRSPTRSRRSPAPAPAPTTFRCAP